MFCFFSTAFVLCNVFNIVLIICYFHFSEKNCVSTPRGTEYMGNISKMSDGQECMPWRFFYDNLYIPNKDIIFLPDSITHASNYCRQTLWFKKFKSPVCVNKSLELITCNIENCRKFFFPFV